MAPSKHLDTLLTLNQKKERIFRRVQVTYDLIKTLPQKIDTFVARAEEIKVHFKEFDSILSQITEINVLVDKADQVEVDQAATSFDELYYAIKAAYDKYRDQPPAPEANSQRKEDSFTNPQLPKIQIPPFSGQYEQFPAFISLFDALIHSRNHSSIVKFSYLKSLLTYPASQTIASIEFKAENYKEAYDKLVARYSNKRIVASHHLYKIIQFKPFSTDNATNFRAFLDTFEDNFNALNALKIENLADFMMLHLSLNVLDINTRRRFENQTKEQEVPTFTELTKFIKAQARVAELCYNSTTKSSVHKPNLSGAYPPKPKALFARPDNVKPVYTSKQPLECPLCHKAHKILACPEFSASNITSRYEILKRFRLCFSCSGPHHLAKCQSSGRCQTCGSNKHNTMLHRDDTSNNTSLESSCPQANNHTKKDQVALPTEPALQNVLSCHMATSSQALLGTARCSIRSDTGQWYNCRIVIDPGSHINFISSSMANKLNLKKTNNPLSVTGVADTSIPISQSEVNFLIAPKSGCSTFKVAARVITNIVSQLPLYPVPFEVRQRLLSLDLADPEFHIPSHVDLLLGVRMYGEILSNPPMFIKDTPCAIHTIFGWIVFGEIPSSIPNPSVTSFLSVEPLQEYLKRFWEAEEVSVSIPPNPEDVHCESHFQKTVTRDKGGRYIVSLPFLADVPIELSSTREQALLRFKKLETRFLKDPLYFSAYAAQMNEYIQLDHVRKANTKSSYLMTHHGVAKESTSTKLRVVFNGSEKSSYGNSLNDLLCTGPQLQTDIGKLIDNFRTYPIALTCDIKMMFRCVRLHETDRRYVHFLWRSDPFEPITEYELTTLPFGLKCAPFVAQRVIIQLYQDEAHRFPLAQKCLEETYVDNVISGAESAQQTLQLYEQLVALYQAGGFTLRKFSSNCPQVLSKIPHELQDQPLIELDDANSFLTVKVLGLKWNPERDVLCYHINLQEPIYTKRGALSIIARIFDINGYLSPVTFWAKYLIQRLWLRKIDWDEELPDDLKDPWSVFLSELPCLHDVHIPRYILNQDLSSIQMISFADASERGYGCVVYLRTETASGEVQMHLLRARSKVAPLKTISINRLELNAAFLTAKVIESLASLRHTLKIEATFCFSDSKDVLYWLQTPPHRLKIYVANRVVQILSITEPSWWNYIPSEANPADCLSRGLTPKKLLNHNLYWNGPDFLLSKPALWPITQPEPPDEPLELKPSTFLAHEEPNSLLDYLNKYSSLLKVIRVLSFCLRFIRSFTNSTKCLRLIRPGVNSGPAVSTESSFQSLTSTELDESLLTYVRLSQQEYYQALITSLKRGQIPNGSLAKLSPFLSDDGTIRVGGRLKNAPIAFTARHPQLVHSNSHLAILLCDHYHLYSLHGGPQLVQSLIHRKYWIPSLRNLVRKRIFRCISCFKSKVKPTPPLMGDLPKFRVSPARAFDRVGVDYGGPFKMKTSSRRNAPQKKCWIALFVCPCTHAVHLEAVTDLTTSSFIATMDRFIARRGLPSHIYSDCGTNFVGAARKLKKLYVFLKESNNEIADHISQRNIQWHFNPPASPHFGGLWESAIKSAKRHLLAVLQDHAFTYEEFATLLSRVEAVLNSRPITAISNHPSDNLDYLSPGHFLIGQPLLARPEEASTSVFSFNSRWEMLSRSLRHFWKRWHHEYLHTLTPRLKWNTSQENIKEGQLVILHERDTPIQEWILARVMETLPGSDGVVRVVRLKTPHSVLVRPVHKIVPLPCGDTTF